MQIMSIKKVCTTEAAHTEKRKPRLSPNKFQAMIGRPHNNLMEFAFLPNSHSYCAQKKGIATPLREFNYHSSYEICLAIYIISDFKLKIKGF